MQRDNCAYSAEVNGSLEDRALDPMINGQFRTISDIFHYACHEYDSKPAFTNLDHTLSFRDIEKYSRYFGAWIQNRTDLVPGDRIIIQLPNILQFPVAVFGALRAGLIVVNTNPLYSARELEHQIKDSGAKAIMTFANAAYIAAEVIPDTQIKHVIITDIADMLPAPKRILINGVIRYIKKMVPPYHIHGSHRFLDILAIGKYLHLEEHLPENNDTALLQYTGGTTGVAKGAMLTHRNMVANMLQTRSICGDIVHSGAELFIAPLPMYHIYSFTLHCMVSMFLGAHNILITNPRDMPAFIKELNKHDFTLLTGLNTLFAGLMRQPGFHHVDFSHLKLTFSGGMALQQSVAEQWEEITHCEVCEGYGMTETSPIACVNRLDNVRLGTVGQPLPGTEVKIIGSDGQTLTKPTDRGEFCIRGPQVMAGYWNRKKDTKKVLSKDGWLRTGDVATICEDGFVSIVDRVKDMIIVSGFNVYPNEVEELLVKHPHISQCAIIGLPNETTGESIKAFVVKEDPKLTDKEIISYCRHHMAAYKIPRIIEFRRELPTTSVGKVLRRELRDEELKKCDMGEPIIA
ncbi:AMP-binding protein [Sansalvadorimonas sp. 2012CJ34-2]|uniref:Long-chain-fatty-acid--CoA ligase n=1 Tax=Parendozoicomonas callyspongiae TaxID=2942213 RepID=A0ABT0PK19_9GAMM|nr:AMP-binding protein [Sansalvadorimonas sp. 2012CJ34-2]MCL6271735.1 AMP-binding protein [Sansalvadorimonas sp. 2012CJ34-2]